MQRKITLMGGAALCAVLALGFAASADAKVVKHHHVAAKPAADDKVSALSSEVETLETRLEAESLAREQLQAQVQQAQSQAAAAQADADAAHKQLQAQIQTIPGVVSTAIAANKPKPTWADNTTVSARVFSDVSNISMSPSPKATNGTGFDIKRAYLGVDHKFNDIWSASLLVDFAPNGIDVGTGSGSAGATPVQGSEVVKNAFIQAKFDPALVVQVGEASMPWIPFVEDVYGYRYVEKVAPDLNKVGNSADTGAFVKGSFAGGIFNYAVAAVDGAGYKNAVRSSGVDFEGRVNVNYMGFIGAVGGYTGKESLDIQNATPTTLHTATREDALVAYTNSTIRVGYEYFEATAWKTLASVKADKQDENSVFGSFNFTPKIAAFGRYDWGNPSKNLAPSEKNTYYNLGLSYEPVKVVDLALVWKHESLSGFVSGHSFSDGNATFGANGHYDEVGLFTQYRF
jgi:outer membrane murein-binding lipoprotein Lpp